MAYQTVRALGRLRALTARLNGRDPLPAIAALQWVALAQLLDPIRPAAVIVDQAVSAARTLSRSPAGAASFLNATLRRFGRERDGLLAGIADDRVVRYEHPEWWLDRLMHDYPDDWQSIVQAGNRQAPLVLRVNLQRIDLAACAARLAQAGIATRVVGPQALALERAVPVEAIPGFAQGEVSVQDAGAQMAARLLDLADGQRVLDACAAPGGKSTHLLEGADIELVALDSDAGRLRRVSDNLGRLGQMATLAAADAAHLASWWDGRPFQRILLDAPCSGSGVVRRHPDIKWLRRASDLPRLAAQQRRLLDALWTVLAPGGSLLYCTCSVFPAENEAVLEAFLADQPGARRVSCVQQAHTPAVRGAGDASDIAAARGDADRSSTGDLRLLPDPDHDGFHYALLSKP
jgi:16S rRNA (cytosine967-C5)-methyltransferase